jgi:hypothetical protein
MKTEPAASVGLYALCRSAFQSCVFAQDSKSWDKRPLMIAALRYYDTFVQMDGSWLFAERLLYVDWLEERALS